MYVVKRINLDIIWNLGQGRTEQLIALQSKDYTGKELFSLNKSEYQQDLQR